MIFSKLCVVSLLQPRKQATKSTMSSKPKKFKSLFGREKKVRRVEYIFFQFTHIIEHSYYLLSLIFYLWIFGFCLKFKIRLNRIQKSQQLIHIYIIHIYIFVSNLKREQFILILKWFAQHYVQILRPIQCILLGLIRLIKTIWSLQKSTYFFISQKADICLLLQNVDNIIFIYL